MCFCSETEEPAGYEIQSGILTDDRDGQTYKTVKIGEQWWMAENLAYETDSGSYAYQDNEENIPTYGRLYTLDAAIEACPDGWHLPNDNEWAQLGEFIEKDRGERNISSGNPYTFNAGKYLKSKTGWGGSGTDYYGFNGYAAGAYFHSASYYHKEKSAFWWSGSEYSNPYNFQNLFYWRLDYGDSFLSRKNYLDIEKEDGFSVRCIKDR